MKNIKYILSNDWQGLYLNGELVLEDHSLHPTKVLESLGIKFELLSANEEWLEEQGRFPEKFADVVLDEEQEDLG
jgi:hypothetical protein